MSRYFISTYSNADCRVSYWRREHRRLMTRASFSYGISFGLLLMILSLAGNNYPFPIFLPLLQGSLFIYGSVMTVLGFRLLNNQIAKAETDKLNSWSIIEELEFSHTLEAPP